MRSASRLPPLATALALVASLCGCGLLGGNDEPPPGEPEVSSLNVSIMKTTDLAPFLLAVKEGFFDDEGLDVAFVDAPSGGDSVDRLIAGEVDIAYSSYPPLFLAESRRAGQDEGGIRIVADAASASPNSCVVVALPSSSVTSAGDLAGKRVAVTATGTTSDLLTMSRLREEGVDHDTVQWITTPFPAMADALRAGDVDAAFVTEPFLSQTRIDAGAVPIFDAATGPTADLPVAGWGTTGDFVRERPRTVAAFQRAMRRGTDLALSDRGLVDPLLVEFAGVAEAVAREATLLTFRSTPDAGRLQRVPDLMLEFGVIEEELDATTMIVPTAPPN